MSNGSTSVSGSIVTSVNSQHNGNDSFTFKANDGTVDSAAGTVNITVNAINDTQPLQTELLQLHQTEQP